MCLNVHCHVISVSRPQIKIPETEYYQKMSSHAQIRPQGAEKQLSKVKCVLMHIAAELIRTFCSYHKFGSLRACQLFLSAPLGSGRYT